MTVSLSDIYREDYVAAGGATTFAYRWKVHAKTWHKVYVNGVLKTLFTHYDVTGVGLNAGGNIVFGTGLVAGDKVTILPNVPLDQLIDYQYNDKFPEESTEQGLDKLTMILRQFKEEIGRALKFDSLSAFKDVEVNDPVAGQVLRWSTDLGKVESIPLSTVVPGTLTATLAIGGVAFASSLTNLDTDLSLVWDDSGKKLTIGLGTQVDSSVWGQTLDLRLIKDMTAAGSGSVGSANEFAATIQTFITGATSSAASYEKAALIVMMQTEDPSTGAILRDAVGIDMRGQITGTNTDGRAWGGIAEAKILTGGDGLLVAFEAEIENHGTPQPLINQTDTKMNIHVTSVGTNYSSVGILFDGTFYNGIIVQGIVECGLWVKDAPTGIRLEGAAPIMEFRESDQTLPAGVWRIQEQGSNLSFQQNTHASGNFSTLNENLRLQAPTNDKEVGIIVLRNTGGTLTVQRVSQGATDTGDAGFRCLQIPN